MVKKSVIAGIVIAVIVIIAAVVGALTLMKPAQKQAAPAVPKLKQITIRIIYGKWVEKPVEMAIPKFLEIAKKMGYDVKIEKEVLPGGGELVQKVEADFAAGTAADIVLVDSFKIPEYAAAGYLEPLDKYVANWSDWRYFPEPMKRIVSYKGHVYGVMMGTDVRMIWYRKDIFKIAGLPEDWQPKSWEDIIEAAKKLAAAKDKIIAYLKQIDPEGFKKICQGQFWPIYIPAGTVWGEATTMQGFYMLLLGADKDDFEKGLNRLYAYGLEKWVGKSTALYRAFKFYYDIYVKYKLAPVEWNYKPDIWGFWREIFSAGCIGIALGGSWEWREGWGPYGHRPLVPCIKRLGFKSLEEYKEYIKTHKLTEEQLAEYDKCEREHVGFAKMPPYEKAPGYREWVTISGGWAWAINAESSPEVKKLAFEFIKIVTSKEIQAEYFLKYVTGLPSRIDVKPLIEKDWFLSHALEYLNFTDFRDALPGYSHVSYCVQLATDKILKESYTPDKALEEYYNCLLKKIPKDRIVVYPVKPS